MDTGVVAGAGEDRSCGIKDGGLFVLLIGVLHHLPTPCYIVSGEVNKPPLACIMELHQSLLVSSNTGIPNINHM